MDINLMFNTLKPRYIDRSLCIPFRGQTGGVKNDTFERQNEYIEINLYNPIMQRMGKCDLPKDKLNSKCSFVIESQNPGQKPMIAEYDPSEVGYLYDRRRKEKFPVNILKTTYEDTPDDYVYNFMSKDLSHCYGYVWFSHHPLDKIQPYDLRCDYPKYGIEGDRIIVDYLRNNDDGFIGGVGELADRVEVRFCNEHGIHNIISDADVNSHIAHYKRGKRFIVPSLYSDDFNFLYEKYGNYNPNEVLEKLIKESDGSPIDLDGWGYMMMYLSKEKFDQYAHEDLTGQARL